MEILSKKLSDLEIARNKIINGMYNKDEDIEELTERYKQILVELFDIKEQMMNK